MPVGVLAVMQIAVLANAPCMQLDGPRLCPDGSYVYRNPNNNCEFDECPADSTGTIQTLGPLPLICTQDVKTCSDGSLVRRNPNNNCEFSECPTVFTADGCLANGANHTVQASATGTVRCCKNGGTCISSTRQKITVGPFGLIYNIVDKCLPESTTFAEAQQACEAAGSRLCTLAELDNGNCCGTGCGYDSNAVWFDNCATQPCVNGRCASDAEGYTCTCDAGFAGANCDVDVPPSEM